jgi:4-hydroxyphenylpyruvate dioxygenase
MTTTSLISSSAGHVEGDVAGLHFHTTIATVTLAGGLEDKLVAAAAAGFDGIELCECDLEASTLTPQQVRTRCADLGLSIDTYQPLRDFDSVDASRFSANLSRAEAKLDLMTALGVELLVAVSGVSGDAVGDDCLLIEQLQTLADRAAVRGIKVAYEALGWGRYVRAWDHAWAIVAKADHPALGLCLDSFHVLTKTPEPVGIEEIDPNKLFLLQLSDAPSVPATDDAAPSDIMSFSRHHRLFPGQGVLGVSALLGRILETGCTSLLSVEVFNDRFWQADPQRIAADAHRALLTLALSAATTETPNRKA